MNEKIQNSRSRFGLQMTSYAIVKKIFEAGVEKQLTVIFGTDQCPHIKQQPYWTTFLNQETGVQFGSEKSARDNNTPVIYGLIKKIKRGHYEMQYRLVSEFPNDLPIGALSEMHTRMLEEDIIENPSYWLWTHKRWKRKKIDFDRYQERIAAEELSA
jgi:KDO2-lipid IV(A) lauroyltransferase